LPIRELRLKPEFSRMRGGTPLFEPAALGGRVRVPRVRENRDSTDVTFAPRRALADQGKMNREPEQVHGWQMAVHKLE